MDESGYRFGQGGSERVLVPDGDKAALFKAQPGSQEKVFDATTRLSMPSEYRLLIVNSHGLHTNLTFINTCWSHCIIPFLLPPHSTHILQPLDVSIFGPLTTAYRWIINNVAAHVDSNINKAQFGTFYAQAREQALTQMTARKAFSNLGITTTPSAEKVLARLPSSTTQMPQIPPLKDILNILSTNTSVNAMLNDFKDSTEQRDQQQLKCTLLQAVMAAVT
ncbi:hypothetical protein NDA16_003432 [Ustilago loliicola]|nr:hypothetical protein NDA16_003432 [Ustilago loliicola]